MGVITQKIDIKALNESTYFCQGKSRISFVFNKKDRGFYFWHKINMTQGLAIEAILSRLKIPFGEFRSKIAKDLERDGSVLIEDKSFKKQIVLKNISFKKIVDEKLFVGFDYKVK